MAAQGHPAWCICTVQKGGVLVAKLATLAAALLLYSPAALAWGGLGHEAICELAFLKLDDTARQRVIALIRQDEEFATLPARVHAAAACPPSCTTRTMLCPIRSDLPVGPGGRKLHRRLTSGECPSI
jgi:hypothetical protein